MKYYQNEETGRVVMTDSALNQRWIEITKEQYEACEKVTTENIVLKREGFKDITLRHNGGGWQILEYIDHYGGKRWSKNIDETKFDVEAHIKQYGNLPR